GEAPFGLRGDIRYRARCRAQVHEPQIRERRVGVGAASICGSEIDAADRGRIVKQWEGPEHQAIEDGEYRHVRPDAQSQRQDHSEGEAGRATQAAQRVADVLHDCVDGGKTPSVAAFLAQTADIADATTGGGQGVRGGHAFALEVAREERHVGFDLAGELVRHGVPASPGRESAEQFAERHDSAPRRTRVVTATDRLNWSSSTASWRVPAAVSL